MSVAQATVTQKVNQPPRRPNQGLLGPNFIVMFKVRPAGLKRERWKTGVIDEICVPPEEEFGQEMGV